MEISILVEDRAIKIDADWLRRVVEQVLAAQNAAGKTEMSLVLVDQERIQELNRQYLGKDRPTDVISFSMLSEEPAFIAPPDGVTHLGEVIISYPQAVIQAGEQGHSVARELAILIVHGILHLYGYDDERPETKKQMQSREKEILGSLQGVPA